MPECLRVHEEFPAHLYNEDDAKTLSSHFEIIKNKLIRDRMTNLTKKQEAIDAFESILDGKPEWATINEIIDPEPFYMRRY